MSLLGGLVLLLSSALAAVPAAQTLSVPLAARTLAERAFLIPDDLPDRPSLLIVGFSRNSGTPAADWRHRLAQDERLREAVEVYQVAVLESVPRLLRGMVVSGIRRDVPSSQHDRFLVVTRGEAAWKVLTSHTEPDAACLVLIMGERVLWRSEGAYTEAAMSALRSALATPADVP